MPEHLTRAVRRMANLRHERAEFGERLGGSYVEEIRDGCRVQSGPFAVVARL
jgi:hypothetical protein